MTNVCWCLLYSLLNVQVQVDLDEWQEYVFTRERLSSYARQVISHDCSIALETAMLVCWSTTLVQTSGNLIVTGIGANIFLVASPQKACLCTHGQTDHRYDPTQLQT